MWAVGMVIALVAIGLLVAKLYLGIWEALSRERVATLIGIGVALTVIIVLLALGGASLGWTGFGDKKLWDWLQLLSALAIPVVIALGTLWFTAQQNEQQRLIEERRAQAERELEDQRAQDAALQAYLDQMSTLLLEKDLRNSEEDSEVRTLARARTLTVLGRLDPSRKTAVMEFLMEADLAQGVEGRQPIIRLSGADLHEADLVVANLSGADLGGAKLFRTDLERADLGGADLSSANLEKAWLYRATLSDANLEDANLFLASLSEADLEDANLRDATLTNVLLGGGNLPGADLRRAFLIGADVSAANLAGTDLSGAQLSGTDLIGTNLSNANLSEADLVHLQDRFRVVSYSSDHEISNLRTFTFRKGA